jgi:hypothetical protein
MASHGTLAAKYNISWKRGGSVVVRNQPIADNPPPGFLTNREYAWTPAALKAPAGVRCGRIKSQERESQKLKEEGNAFSVRTMAPTALEAWPSVDEGRVAQHFTIRDEYQPTVAVAARMATI